MCKKLYQDISIGENLRFLRKRAGFTQDVVASRLQIMGFNVSREIISQIESGRHNITISMLFALKELYQVTSFDEFFQNADCS